jgi:CHAT domain-containing protein/tetratricopeptide (TPR) repeat protein
MGRVHTPRAAALSRWPEVVFALFAAIAFAPSWAQSCQAAPSRGTTLEHARQLYEAAHFDASAGAYADIAEATDADVSSRLAAMSGWELALKAQACDPEALAVDRERLATAVRAGDTLAARASTARLARSSLARDSTAAESMARQVLDDPRNQPGPDDASSDALTTLASLSISRGDPATAATLLAESLRRATSSLRASEAWRTLGVLRQWQPLADRGGDARQAFQKALALAREARDPEASAMASIYVAGTEADPAVARSLRDAVRTTAQASGMRRVAAIADQQEAVALRPAATFALRTYRADLLKRAVARFAEIGDSSQERNVQLDLASCLYLLGDVAGSSAAAQRASGLSRMLGYTLEVAKAEHLLGLLALEQPVPDLATAQAHLQQALGLVQDSNDLSEWGRELNDLAVVELARGNYDDALDHLALAERLTARSQQADASTLRDQLLVTLGWTLMAAGRDDEATAPLRMASLSPTSAEARGQAWWGLARLSVKRQPEVARVFYERALVSIKQLQPAGAEVPSTAQAVFAGRYSSLYRELAALLVNLKEPARAQYVAGLMQDRELVEAHWAPVRGSAGGSDPQWAAPQISRCESALQSRETDYFQRWSSTRQSVKTFGGCCRRSAAGSTCPGPRDAAQTTCHELLTLDAESRDLDAEENDCLTALASSTSDSTFPVTGNFPDQWRKVAGGTATLVVTLLTPGQLHVIVRGPGTAGFVTRSKPIASGAIDELVQRWINERNWAAATSRELQGRNVSPQRAADLRQQLASHVEVLKTGLLRELYALLLQDVSPFLQSATDPSARPYLVLSLDGALRDLPIAALYDGEHYLGERAAIALLTPTTLEPFETRAMPKSVPLVAGMSALADPALPGVAVEVQAVGQLLGATPLLDRDATKAHVLGWLDDLAAQGQSADVLHIAAHGASGGTPTTTVIDLADAELTGAQLYDERDSLRQVRLVVLSACGSASPGRGELALGLAGIAQQGSRSVIGSLWEVDDHATADLMVAFYRQWKLDSMSSVSRALASAQDLVRGKYPHPYYWAAFAAIGRWD